MLSPAARTMMVLVLAVIALASFSQGAAARGGSGGVTVIVKSDGWTGHRAMHHSHRFGALKQWHKQRRLAEKNSATRAFQRSAAHRFDVDGFAGHHFHQPPHRAEEGKNFHKPRHAAHSGYSFKGPRIIVVAPSGTQRSAAPGVVVLRGSNSAVTVLGSGKAVVFSTSPSFKHIVIGK